MNDSATTPPKSVSPSKGHRLWMTLTVLCLALVAVVGVRLQPELERNFKGWLTTAIVLLALSLELLWFFFLSRLPGRVRWGTALGLGLLFFAARQSLRVQGTLDGTGLPNVTWRWNHAQARLLPTASSDAPPAPSTAEAIPDVPGFFGPQRDGKINGAALSGDWKTTPPKLLWRQPIGAGWSAFAVVGGRAFTQEQRGEEESVTCYDVRSGKLLWRHSNAVRFFEWQGGEGPRATPSVFEGRVYAMGATGILNCLEATSGKSLWSHDVLSEFHLANLTWGMSASPLVFEDTVVVTGGLTNACTLLAFRASTGQALWQAGSDKASYASPVLATLAGRRLVLSLNASSLTGHDPQSGALLFRFPWSDDKWPKAAQPVVAGENRVFISAGYGAGCALLEVEAAPEGKLSVQQIWKSLRMKTQFNSVALRDGFLYGLDDGLMACVELSTGDRKWKSGRFGSGQTLLVDEMALIQSEAGPVILANATPEGFLELGRLPALSAKTWNHPTLAGRFLLVRNSEEAACYELPLKAL